MEYYNPIIITEQSNNDKYNETCRNLYMKNIIFEICYCDEKLSP